MIDSTFLDLATNRKGSTFESKFSRTEISIFRQIRVSESFIQMNKFCQHCGIQTEHFERDYRSGDARWGCRPCSDRFGIVLRARMNFRMTLKCQKCGERKGENLGGHFFKRKDEPEEYICENCTECSLCEQKIHPSQGRVLGGKDYELVSHDHCFLKRKGGFQWEFAK